MRRTISVSLLHPWLRKPTRHPGGAGGADFVNVLFSEFLVYDPENPAWEGRDRFFLDPGHMSPMLYSTLALTGKFTLDERKSSANGKPLRDIPNVTSCAASKTLPVRWDRDILFAVGAAIAAKFMKARFEEVMPQTIYAYISTVASRKKSQGSRPYRRCIGLDNSSCSGDANDIQLSTETKDVTIEDTGKKYEVWGWKVIKSTVTIDAIRGALNEAKAEKECPTLIIGQTVMGKGAARQTASAATKLTAPHTVLLWAATLI